MNIISAGIVFVLFLALSGISFAMTSNNTIDSVAKTSGQDQSTGLFGGLRPDGTFVFLYSETKGVRFYRIESGVRATFAGVSYDLSSLPLKTPIKVKVRSGKIVAVELQGVMQ